MNQNRKHRWISPALALTSALFAAACATGTSPVTSPTTPPSTAGEAVTYSDGEGKGCDDAIVIKGATSERAGIKAEYAWLAAHYPGYHTVSQSLIACKSATDEITITTAAGATTSVYFEISSFMGKW